MLWYEKVHLQKNSALPLQARFSPLKLSCLCLRLNYSAGDRWAMPVSTSGNTFQSGPLWSWNNFQFLRVLRSLQQFSLIECASHLPLKPQIKSSHHIITPMR